jgi:hypothetical protein
MAIFLLNQNTKVSLVVSICIIGGIIALAGLLIFLDSWKQTKWVRVDAVVLESKIIKDITRSTRETSSNQSWAPYVKYSYQVEGKSYTSDFYSSTAPRSNAKDNTPPTQSVENAIALYPQGAHVSAFVSPSNSERVVLVRPESANWKVLGVGIIIVVISGLGFLFWL